jgi:hypothetical protein
MKAGLLMLALFLSQPVFAVWTGEPTLKATVWSYDKNCVKLKLPDGKFQEVKRSLLPLKDLQSRKTIFEYQPDSLPTDGCPKK